MEAVSSVVVLLSFVVFLWAVVGLINPVWARLPNRWSSVTVWLGSVALLLIGSEFSKDGDNTPASSASRVPQASAVAEPIDNTPTEPRTTCAGQVLSRAKDQVGDNNVKDVEVRGGGTGIVVSYTKSVGLTVGWMRVGLIFDAMDLMQYAYTEPACRQLLRFGLISYTDGTDRFGHEKEVKASEMWLDRDAADRINWSAMSSDRHRFEALIKDFGKLWMHPALR